ncbi:MAG: hypothetical protein GY820_37125 [Gammaproteobacteria bacterium]|nr:hypothetical protein [Gammaproteobacteria bacterium]
MDSQLIEVLTSNAARIGLALDIAGVVLLFSFGPPAPDVFLDGSEIVTTNPDPKKARRAKLRNNISKFALVLLIVGFSFQIVGNNESSRTISQLENENQVLTGDLKLSNSIISGYVNNYNMLEASVMEIKKSNESKSSSIEDKFKEMKESITQLETIVKSYNKKIQPTQKTRG